MDFLRPFPEKWHMVRFTEGNQIFTKVYKLNCYQVLNTMNVSDFLDTDSKLRYIAFESTLLDIRLKPRS